MKINYSTKKTNTDHSTWKEGDKVVLGNPSDAIDKEHFEKYKLSTSNIYTITKLEYEKDCFVYDEKGTETYDENGDPILQDDWLIQIKQEDKLIGQSQFFSAKSFIKYED